MEKIENRKSNIEHQFVPFTDLDLERIDKGNGKPAEPVNWFQVLAPELPDTSAAPVVAVPLPIQKNGVVPTFATFRDVNEIVREERERRMMGTPEPPEIMQMRYEAEQTAQQLVGQAYVQAQTVEDEARKEGYAAGFAQGLVEGRDQAERVVSEQAQQERQIWRHDIAEFVSHVEAARQQAWEAIEPQIIQMVFELAKHVIKQEIEISRDVSLSVVRNALRRVAESGSLRIRVNAEDLQTVRGNREELLTLVDNIRHVEIIEDRRVGVGGCIVETDAGNIDARLETQLAEAANLLELN